MYIVQSKNACNIANLLIKTNYDEKKTIFDLNVTYVDNHRFNVEVNLLDGNDCKIYFINKNDENNYFYIEIKDCNYYTETLYAFFEIIKDEETTIYKIPRIIHQSYKKHVKKNMYNAINTWKQMNINYEYKYWDDDNCYKFIKEFFDEKVLDAYNTLYAGAYKSDIFRLCVLYIQGGVWTDISSSCYCSLDKIIVEEKLSLVFVKDNPSQINNGNIYQAFIIAEPKNIIIKSILDFTVDKVINNEHYNIIYPHLKHETIAVTGPTAFAIGLNKFLGRPDFNFFNDNSIDLLVNDNLIYIKFLDHYPGEIKSNGNYIIKTKYDDWGGDRINFHYTTLHRDGFIYKKKINDVIDGEKPFIYQIWIQNEFVTSNMYNVIQDIKNKHQSFNYMLLTNEKILKFIENDEEFPLLLKAYNKIKPFGFKSDLIRYYILYKNGGIYMDTDFININDITELYNNYDFVFCKDLDVYQMFNAFICVREKRHPFFKIMVEKVIDNILNKTSFQSDLYITGPGVLGECVSQYFNISRPYFTGDYLFEGLKIKILNHSLDLPFPKGSWIDSAKNYYVKDNTLYAECRNSYGKWIKNSVKFNVGDNIINNNGYLNNNTHIDYTPCDGSTILYDNDKIYFFTKFPNFNTEKLMLNGNDYSEMYKNNNLFND